MNTLTKSNFKPTLVKKGKVTAFDITDCEDYTYGVWMPAYRLEWIESTIAEFCEVQEYLATMELLVLGKSPTNYNESESLSAAKAKVDYEQLQELSE